MNAKHTKQDDENDLDLNAELLGALLMARLYVDEGGASADVIEDIDAIIAKAEGRE